MGDLNRKSHLDRGPCPCPQEDTRSGKTSSPDTKKVSAKGYNKAAADSKVSNAHGGPTAPAKSDDLKALENWRRARQEKRHDLSTGSDVSTESSGAANTSSPNEVQRNTDEKDHSASGSDQGVKDYPGTMATERAHDIGAARNIWMEEQKNL